MAKNRKKVHRKIAVTFLFVGRFLRSIHQKTANYPRFTMRYRPERIRAAFGPYRRKTDFFTPPRCPKSPATFYPIFFSEALFFICAGPLAKVSLFAHVLPTHRHLARIAPILGVGPSLRTFVWKIAFDPKNCRFSKSPNRGKMLIETPNSKSETSPSLGQMHILSVLTDCLESEKVCGNVGSESGYRLIVRFRSILERDLNCF